MQVDTRNLPNECVVGVYATIDKAQAAVVQLDNAGYSREQVSVVVRHLDPDGKTAAALSMGDDSLRDAAVGGALGGLTGVVGAGAFITVTGIGLILMTGPLLALTGAIVGAFLGAMKGWGIHEANIEEYERLVREGHVLVVVTGEPQAIERAEKILHDTSADKVYLHAKTSDDSPEIDDRAARR